MLDCLLQPENVSADPESWAFTCIISPTHGEAQGSLSLPRATQPARGRVRVSIVGCPAPNPMFLLPESLPLEACGRFSAARARAVKVQVRVKDSGLQGDHRRQDGMWLQESGRPVQGSQIRSFRTLCSPKKTPPWPLVSNF